MPGRGSSVILKVKNTILKHAVWSNFLNFNRNAHSALERAFFAKFEMARTSLKCALKP